MNLTIILILVIVALLTMLIGAVQSALKIKKELEVKLQKAENKSAALQQLLTTYAEKLKKNEELKQKMEAAPDADSFAASLELLRKQAEAGEARNK